MNDHRPVYRLPLGYRVGEPIVHLDERCNVITLLVGRGGGWYRVLAVTDCSEEPRFSADVAIELATLVGARDILTNTLPEPDAYFWLYTPSLLRDDVPISHAHVRWLAAAEGWDFNA